MGTCVVFFFRFGTLAPASVRSQSMAVHEVSLGYFRGKKSALGESSQDLDTWSRTMAIVSPISRVDWFVTPLTYHLLSGMILQAGTKKQQAPQTTQGCRYGPESKPNPGFTHI